MQARERVSAVKRAFRTKVGELQKEHEEWRKLIENHQQTVKVPGSCSVCCRAAVAFVAAFVFAFVGVFRAGPAVAPLSLLSRKANKTALARPSVCGVESVVCGCTLL